MSGALEALCVVKYSCDLCSDLCRGYVAVAVAGFVRVRTAGGREGLHREGCAALPMHAHEGNDSVPRCGEP